MNNIVAGAQCGPYEVTEPGNITTTDYTNLVGEQHECTWLVEAPNNTFAIQLNVEALELAVIHVPNERVSSREPVLCVQFLMQFVGY